MSGRVVVVGLGPAGVDLLLPAARRAIEGVSRRYARTRRHPALEELCREGLEFATFDHLYEAGDSLDEVYRVMADTLCRAAAEVGEVLFAVPGSPGVAERTVALLAESGAELAVVPGLSFADYAWSRLGVDPLGGARLVDARSLAERGLPLQGGPLLVAQCDDRLVLSDVKLALLERLDADASVTVLWHLGLPDEELRRVPLAELDHHLVPDHLMSLAVELPEDRAAVSWARLVALIERLRAPGGCPWDAEQTHHSLARHLLEETYEVLQAIEALPPSAPGGDVAVPPGDYTALADELGDLACQVVFHATLAREADAFDVGDVATAIHDKLVRRHPHVFGDVEVDGAEAVLENWERLKRAERPATSLIDGIPRSLPALALTHKLLRKAAAVGLPWGTPEEAADEAIAAVEALRALREPGRPSREAKPTDGPGPPLARLLVAAVRLAHAAGVDAETALRAWAGEFTARFTRFEALAGGHGEALETLDPDLRTELWERTGDAPS